MNTGLFYLLHQSWHNSLSSYLAECPLKSRNQIALQQFQVLLGWWHTSSRPAVLLLQCKNYIANFVPLSFEIDLKLRVLGGP